MQMDEAVAVARSSPWLSQHERRIQDAICARMNIQRQNFDFRWLDVESLFERQGWFVHYEKQCIGDSEPSYFLFEAKPSSED
jgi:hypothetical protein